MNSHDDLVASSDSERDEVRARFLRLGKLPELKKGDEVWVEDFSGWSRATVVRRITGNCYIAKPRIPFMGVEKVVVMVKTFGGKVA